MASIQEFFETRGIFTLEELAAFDPSRSPRAIESLLQYHLARHHIFRIHRGVYQVEDHYSPILDASKLAPDAVLAYDTALALHHPHASPWVDRVTVMTRARRRSFPSIYEGGTPIHPVRPPAALGSTWRWFLKEVDCCGHAIRIPVVERTLVDVLHRIDLAPEFRVLWTWFAHNALDVDLLVHWARKLRCTLTAARLAFFLEWLPWASASQIGRLPRLTRAAYFDRARRPSWPLYDRRSMLVVSMRAWRMIEQTDFRCRPARIPPDDQLPP